MCGLAGILLPGKAEIDADLLRTMTTALAHRGPDGDGFHVEPGIGFGHRRLAIIDVAGGIQPMFNEDHSVVIIFNGEIYNYAELWPKLVALGHVFRTDHSDTETIVHAWESWGPDCLQHLNGQFSFALWDRNRGQLFLARDRLGKKPMHYARPATGGLVFASELRGLTCVPGLDLRINAAAVDDFFATGSVPDPATIYEGIHKLPAAHYVLFDQDGRTSGPQRYWGLNTAEAPTGEAEAIETLRGLLGDATRLRLISDVPLGAFLSGGVDSSAVVATAAGLRDTKLTTFTIGFDGAEDETPFAQMMATRYGTDQHAERASAVDYIEAARQQGAIFGEPFGDQSSVPTYTVCALARRHATVAVSGDGGDEVFAGYRRHRWHAMTEAVRAYIPSGVRRHALGTLAAIYPKLDRAPRFLRAKHTLTELSLDSALGYARMLTKMHHNQRRALFSASLRARLSGYSPNTRLAGLMEAAETDDALRQAQYVDINSYLVDDINTKVDRAAMANSLEVRSPFLDYRMVQFGMSLPAALKLRDRQGKYVLKKAMEPLVPGEILYRQKQGFATSLAGLFRAEMPRLRARLLGEAMLGCGLFELTAIATLLDQHEQGAFDHSGVLWLLLVFEGFLVTERGLPAGRAVGREAVLA
jgi:asparagine synthase (glutamine-hydrolysing)